MKSKFALILLVVLLIMACENPKKAKLRIDNKLKNVTLQSIFWGKEYVCGGVSPNAYCINEFSTEYGDDWVDKTQPLTLTFKGNLGEVRAVTVDSIEINVGSDLNYFITDSTRFSKIN